MSATVFVDTNILVYARQANEPLKQPVAVQWMERLWQDQLGVLEELTVKQADRTRPLTTAPRSRLRRPGTWQRAGRV